MQSEGESKMSAKEKEVFNLSPTDQVDLHGDSVSLSVQSSLSEGEGRGKWGKQLDFFLSCVGYAVGLGNLWRFPYLCMRNGGGAFLIPYFLFLFLCGIPLYFMELSLGQFSSRSPMSMWEISPLFKGLGLGMVLVSGVVCVYYNVIMAWSLYFMGMSFTTGELPWATCNNDWNTPACTRRSGVNVSRYNASNATDYDLVHTVSYNSNNSNTTADYMILKKITPAEEFWNHKVLHKSEGIEHLGFVHWELLLCLVAAWIIVFACLCKGVKSSGKVVYVTATAPYVMLVVLLVRGVTLPGSVEGIKYYITPDFERLLDFRVWSEACAQIFYSLGPAYGGLITMSSYNRFNNNCYRDALIIPLINCLTSFFVGFVVFSILGFLAYETGLPVDKVITQGPGLVFMVYPEALSLLPFAPVWSVIFFLMLIIIGLDTQFGMFETMTSGFVDEFPKTLQGRKTLFTAIMCGIQFLLGIPIVCEGGIYIFQIMDWYAATFSLITISTIECTLIAWVYGADRMYADIALMIGYKPNVWWKICWMALTPAALVTVMIFTIVTFSQPELGSYTYPDWAISVGWLLATFSLWPIPIVMVVRLLGEDGSLLQRLTKLLHPTPLWGPASHEDRKGTKYDVMDSSKESIAQKSPLV